MSRADRERALQADRKVTVQAARHLLESVDAQVRIARLQRRATQRPLVYKCARMRSSRRACGITSPTMRAGDDRIDDERANT